MSPEVIIPSGAPVPARLHDALRDRGFVRKGTFYCRDALRLTASGPWYELREPLNSRSEAPSLSRLGRPGLWKTVQNGEPLHCVFEIPAWATCEDLEEDRLDESGPVSFGKLLDWALATRPGRVPPGWVPPDSDRVKSWLPHGALTVQTKGYVRQGELILEENRWALRMPILPRIHATLPERRHRVLGELIAETQRQWAMVRVGITADTVPPALIAEVDLTGAPPSELLFSTGLDGLRHVVAWLVETADVLADPSVEIASLAPGGPTTTIPNERLMP